MKILTKIIALFLVVSLAGCAYNHPNPIARDVSYGATAGALPGLAMMSLLAESDDAADAETELGFFGLSLVVLGGGALVGTAVGAVVGVIQWFIETANYDPTKDPDHPDYIPPQQYQAPEQYDSYDEPQAVRQGEDYSEEAEQAAPQAVRQSEEYAPEAVEPAEAAEPAVQEIQDYQPAPAAP
ncbi:MAG: hypothetical protein MJZ25_07065 [Fibrobacter sp.]|nr:hypothetical protein [Fibrobacter sp.]